MTIDQIFYDLHGVLLEDELLSIESKDPHFSAQIAKTLNIDSKYLYYNLSFSLFPYCYWDGLVYYNFFSLESPGITRSILDHFQYYKKTIHDLKERGDWSNIMTMTDKKVAFQVFFSFLNDIPFRSQKELFLEIYSRVENGFDLLDHNIVRQILAQPTTDTYDVSFYEKPDEFGYYTIYRGEGSKSSPLEKALSWTTDYDIAEFHATRFDDCGRVHHRKVHKSNVRAYIQTRKEKELLIFPQDIRKI